MSEHIDYVELPVGDMAASKDFYASAFGWAFQDYGPIYAAFDKDKSGLDGGLAAADAASSAAPLVILKSDDLEDTLQRVQAAGAEITKSIYEFPGGRRFQFKDPTGNELAVWGT